MNRIFQILLLMVIGILSAQKGTYYQQFAKYKMDIDVDATNFTYQGKQSIIYTNNSPDELSVVYFHLYWNAFKSGSMMDDRIREQGINGDKRLQVNGVSELSQIPAELEGKQNIHWIKQDGKPLNFEVQETIMKVHLATPIKPNTSTTFTMEWDANIPMEIRRSGRNSSEGIDMTMTQWYPKIAEYDYNGWATFDYLGKEFHAPFADFDVNIKIDKDYIIGAGGVLKNENAVKGYSENPELTPDRNGKVTWKWSAKNILDFAWAADRDYSVDEFSILDGPKVYFVYQKSDKTQYWSQAKPYIKRFYQLMNAKFGQYMYPTYSFVQGGDGGMEYGMATMILGESDSLLNLVRLMAHEGAHSWFQQMLATNESTQPWLDEGFTSYAESWVTHQLFPSQKVLPNPFLETINRYTRFTKTGMEEPAIWYSDYHHSGAGYSVAAYVKGELFLVELGYIIGEQALSDVLKIYFEEWKMYHPSDRDFMHIAQKVSKMDLKWFYHYWINTTETIDYSIKNVEYTENGTKITLENKGDIPMPIDFSIFTKDKKIVNYHIPTNLTHSWKEKDAYGDFSTLDYWIATKREYTFTIPFKKEGLQVIGIDFSKRLADVNPQDNFMEIK